MPSPSYVPVIATGRPVDAASVTATGTVAGASVTAGGKLLGADQMPSDHGFEVWTHDPYAPASAVGGVSGTVYVVRLPVRRTYTLAALWWGVVTSGVTPVAGQNEVGLYSPAGTRLGAVNVDAQVTSTGAKRTALSVPVLSSYAFVWAGFVFNNATNPVMLRGSSFESTPSMNLPTTGLRAAVAATGATQLPASFAPAGLTTSNCITFFAALEAA